MSSNLNHTTPVLTHANYEAYFLLYVDDELTPEERKAVEAFVLLHPGLKEELDLLCSTRFPAENFSFGDKETLYADSMKANTVDESLLLYIDDELPAQEKELVETQLKQDAAFALQHQQLLKTKLDKTESLHYPYKSGLYRRTERRIAPVWLRVAAAVVIVAGSGTVAWLKMDRSKSANVAVTAGTPKNTAQQPTPEPKQMEKPITNENINVVATTAKATVSKNTSPKKESRLTPQLPVAKHAVKERGNQTFSKPHTDGTHSVASNNLPATEKGNGAAKTTTDQTDLQQALNKTVVTPKAPRTYNSADDAAKTMVPVNAVATTTDNGRSGGSVKVFLRKATRFIERRTGIKAVNDDDELLVGAVAFKLK